MLYKNLWERTYTPDVIKSSFRQAGISPWNPHRDEFDQLTKASQVSKPPADFMDMDQLLSEETYPEESLVAEEGGQQPMMDSLSTEVTYPWLCFDAKW